jgi:predicted O-linked N-acetylglucosamine transferase (SPINDLY family)
MAVYRAPFGAAGLLGERELPVTPAPLLTNGFPTFGCFNDFSKLSAPVLDVWARLLKAVPGSRLVLKSSELGETHRRMELHHGLAGRGIDPGRLVLLGRDEDAYTHLARYAQIDVALDTFPYNGVTTSFESIWMGVPVVTLAGLTPASRMGVSIATHLGHPEWIAATPDDYVRLAAKLAADAGELNRLRLGLRQELEASPLMDARSFTSKLETLYRQTWRTWCAQRS